MGWGVKILSAEISPVRSSKSGHDNEVDNPYHDRFYGNTDFIDTLRQIARRLAP